MYGKRECSIPKTGISPKYLSGEEEHVLDLQLPIQMSAEELVLRDERFHRILPSSEELASGVEPKLPSPLYKVTIAVAPDAKPTLSLEGQLSITHISLDGDGLVTLGCRLRVPTDKSTAFRILKLAGTTAWVKAVAKQRDFFDEQEHLRQKAHQAAAPKKGDQLALPGTQGKARREGGPGAATSRRRATGGSSRRKPLPFKKRKGKK